MKVRESKIIGSPGEMSGLDVSFDPTELTVEVSGGVFGGVHYDPAVFQAEQTDSRTSIFVRLLRNGEVYFKQVKQGEFDDGATDILHNLAELRFHSGVGQEDDRDFIHIGRVI